MRILLSNALLPLFDLITALLRCGILSCLVLVFSSMVLVLSFVVLFYDLGLELCGFVLWSWS